jgi:hypothetical protein
MIFEAINGSAQAGELLLLDGGYCRWHLRRDGIIVIYEIIATRKGAGSDMIILLKEYGKPIQAKCPVGLPANQWYARQGFVLLGTETTRSGRELNLWRLLPS